MVQLCTPYDFWLNLRKHGPFFWITLHHAASISWTSLSFPQHKEPFEVLRFPFKVEKCQYLDLIKETGQRTRYNDQATPVGLSEIWISNTSRPALRPTVSYSMGRDVLSRDVTPSRTEAKNQSSYNSTPAFLHGVDRDNLLFFTSDTLREAACVSQVRNVFRNIRMHLKFSFALPRHHNYSQLQDLRAWRRRPTNKLCKAL